MARSFIFLSSFVNPASVSVYSFPFLFFSPFFALVRTHLHSPRLTICEGPSRFCHFPCFVNNVTHYYFSAFIPSHYTRILSAMGSMVSALPHGSHHAVSPVAVDCHGFGLFPLPPHDRLHTFGFFIFGLASGSVCLLSQGYGSGYCVSSRILFLGADGRARFLFPFLFLCHVVDTLYALSRCCHSFYFVTLLTLLFPRTIFPLSASLGDLWTFDRQSGRDGSGCRGQGIRVRYSLFIDYHIWERMG